MKKLLRFVCMIAIAGTLASCEHSTTPSLPLTISGGNDVLITGSRAIVLANGSNSLYVVDLSDISVSDRELLSLSEGNYGKTNSTLDAVLFHNAGSKVDTTVELNVLPDSTQRLLATIPFGLDAPNKMALISSNLLLVTRRNANSAAIVDLTKNAIVDSIPIGGVSIAVAVLNNKAYITSGDSEYTGPFQLNVVNLANYQVEKTIPLPQSPEQAIADSANGNVIIGTETDFVSVPPKFYFVNATSDVISDSLAVGMVNDDAELTTGGKHYIILNGFVYPLSGATHTLPSALINSSTTYYKGFYNAAANDLYIGEYNFNIANGKVDVFDGNTGAFKWSFVTGIGPAHFALYK